MCTVVKRELSEPVDLSEVEQKEGKREILKCAYHTRSGLSWSAHCNASPVLQFPLSKRSREFLVRCIATEFIQHEYDST